MNYTKILGVAFTTILGFSLTSCGLFGSSSTSTQQATATKQTVPIKQDFSESKVEFHDTISYNSFEVLWGSCIGNTSEQSVTLTFAINNKVANKSLVKFLPQEAYDENGNSYGFTLIDIVAPENSWNVFMPTNQRVKFSLKIKNVLPNTVKITSLRVYYKFNYPDSYTTYAEGDLLFLNVPIYWN